MLGGVKCDVSSLQSQQEEAVQEEFKSSRPLWA